jgi:predicted metal-binding membrane protein
MVGSPSFCYLSLRLPSPVQLSDPALSTWDLGVRHGLYCLGCCWALMLVMFSVGVTHLTGMLLLSAVMAIEKTSRWGQVVVPVVGVGLLLWGGLKLLSSGTETAILSSSQCSTR